MLSVNTTPLEAAQNTTTAAASIFVVNRILSNASDRDPFFLKEERWRFCKKGLCSLLQEKARSKVFFTVKTLAGRKPNKIFLFEGVAI